MIAQYDPMAPHFRRHWVRVLNGTGSEIPPHSVVVLTGASQVGGEIVLTVGRPNTLSTDFNWCGYYVTGPFLIGASSTSEGLASKLDTPGYVRVDNSATATRGQVWGPKHGQHTLSYGYWGYMVLGGNTYSVTGAAALTSSASPS